MEITDSHVHEDPAKLIQELYYKQNPSNLTRREKEESQPRTLPEEGLLKIRKLH